MGKIKGIVALRENDRAIGNGLDLLYSFPSDLENFKKLTLGQIVVMGRNTWNSLPNKWKPLPGRLNVVLSKNPSLVIHGVRVVHGLEEVLRMQNKDQRDIWIIGGAEVYELFLPHIDEFVITTVRGDEQLPANVFFPSEEAILKQFQKTGKRVSLRRETG